MAANPTPAPELQLNAEQKADEIVVRGTGKITAATVSTLQATIREQINKSKKVVIDLGAVDYIDSSGLGALVSVYMAASRVGCELEIANPKQRIRDLFKLTKLASVFEGHGENYFGGM
jgi:anti-anti-sigma factor